MGIGLVFGPIIGGIIVAFANWQWVFLVHTLISVVALNLVFVGVHESRDLHAQHLDIAGILTLSASCFGLVYFITQGPDLGFLSPAAMTIAALTLSAFIAFVFVEKRSPRPMFDFSVLQIRSFSGALFGSMGMNFSYWPFMTYLPIYFQGALRYTGVNAGLSLLAYTLPTLVIPPLAERLALRFGPRRIIPTGLFIIGIGFTLMRPGAGTAHAGWLAMVPGCLLCGTGLGLTNTLVTNTATGAVSPNRAGMASGMDMSVRLISLAINIAAMGFILLQGVLSHLTPALSGSFEGMSLRPLAEEIASGHIAHFMQGGTGLVSADPTGAIVHAALVHGFGLVMLYGVIGSWTFALLSVVAFGPDPQARRKTAIVNDDTQRPGP